MSQNEKKNEENNQSVVSIFREAYNEELDRSKKYMDYLESEYKIVMEHLSRSKGKARSDLILRKRFLATQMLLHVEGNLARTQALILALQLEQLEDKIQKKSIDASLQQELNDAKQKLDEHLTKRLAQIFKNTSNEAMYT